ncbi:MAG: hypothetical protein ABL859_01915, partial [Methylotenera sp.]
MNGVQNMLFGSLNLIGLLALIQPTSLPSSVAKDQKCIVEISEPFLNEKDASIDSIIGQAKLSDVS